ncbi:hypothetical protein INR49_024151 [Caranx melampygus]|nr:hypothetical protein INR49_024151 [Caranx melampygus]
MFATATKNFVEEVDRGGLLIPVSSLNDTIDILTVVVVKRRRFGFWQRSKYFPTDFHLSDLLEGDTPITPENRESDFIKFNGTYGDRIQGSLDASFVHTNVNLEGKDTSKLQSAFGSLKKEEVNVKKLLKDSKGRVLDMSHCLIQQTKEKSRRVFGIVKERIWTTTPCSVIEEVQQAGFTEREWSLTLDSNVTMEIPINTTLAYSLIELEIKHNGSFELCLMSDTAGGFEVDSSAQLSGVSGGLNSEGSRLRQDLEQLNDHFQLLSSLPVATRSSLLQQLTNIMQDQTAVSTLQDALEQMCLDKTHVLPDVTMAESQKQNIRAVLGLWSSQVKWSQLRRTGPLQSSQPCTSSAAPWMVERKKMTSGCLGVLRMCCSPTVLQTLEQLVQMASGKGECHATALTGDVYEKAEQLFACCNVSLKKDGDIVKMEIKQKPGNLPLVLCIAVRGLASLAP